MRISQSFIASPKAVYHINYPKVFHFWKLQYLVVIMLENKFQFYLFWANIFWWLSLNSNFVWASCWLTFSIESVRKHWSFIFMTQTTQELRKINPTDQTLLKMNQRNLQMMGWLAFPNRHFFSCILTKYMVNGWKEGCLRRHLKIALKT